MPWSDTATCWTLESYDSGVAHLLFPAGDRAARATWSIKDKVEVMRGLSEFGAQQVADDVNDGSGSGDDNTQTTNHATVERVGDSGQYAVRKTTHEVTFEGTEYSDESGASSAGSGGGGLTGG